MKAKPTLIHFTGPTNPDIEIVLNPWVQPYRAKPWGYAGAPGHLFSETWWETLREVTLSSEEAGPSTEYSSTQ